METSRTNDSYASRMTRYTQRIQHIMGRSKSKSKSPFRLNHTKFNKQAPKVSQIDTHLKYEHSFFVLSKIVGLKVKQLLSTSLISIKLTANNKDSNSMSSSISPRLVVQAKPITPKSNIFLFRLRNVSKKALISAFQQIKNFRSNINVNQPNNKQKQAQVIKNNFKEYSITILSRIINQHLFHVYNSIFSKLIVNANAKLKNTRKFNSILSQYVRKKIQSAFITLNRSGKLSVQNIAKFKLLISKYHSKIKYKTIQSLQFCSINFKKRARQDQLEAITSRACVSMFVNSLQSLLNVRNMRSFVAISDFRQDYSSIHLEIPHNQTFYDDLYSSPRQKRFPRQCYKFKRLLQIFYTNQMVLYDQVFHAFYQNKNQLDYLYNGTSVLRKIIIRRAFSKIRQVSSTLFKTRIMEEGFKNIQRLIKVKEKQHLISGFWDIINTYICLPSNQHNCCHFLFLVLNKLHKRRIIESYLTIKCIQEDYSQINPRTQQDKDISSIIIYDDITSFLEQRQEAFNSLKNGYDRLKNMIGGKNNSPIMSTSYESIRAINQIKNRVVNRYNE